MENRFVTHGALEALPDWVQNLLWFLQDNMEVEKKDYLQVFHLSHTASGQRIIHTQEEPLYKKVIDVTCPDAVDAVIYIIDDKTHETMLLCSEY